MAPEFLGLFGLSFTRMMNLTNMWFTRGTFELTASEYGLILFGAHVNGCHQLSLLDRVGSTDSSVYLV